MGDAENFSPQTGPETGDERSLTPWIIGAVIVAALVAVVVLVGHYVSTSAGPAPVNPYVAQLEISGLHMATAENFAGGRVTYIEGRLTNRGDRKVKGARIEVRFKDSLGQVAQKDALPVMVVQPGLPYLDYGSLELAPLSPGQSRDFRLTIEHITAQWDGQMPEARVVSVTTS